MNTLDRFRWYLENKRIDAFSYDGPTADELMAMRHLSNVIEKVLVHENTFGAIANGKKLDLLSIIRAEQDKITALTYFYHHLAEDLKAEAEEDDE